MNCNSKQCNVKKQQQEQRVRNFSCYSCLKTSQSGELHEYCDLNTVNGRNYCLDCYIQYCQENNIKPHCSAE